MTRGQGVSPEPAEGRGSRCAGALGAPMSPAGAGVSTAHGRPAEAGARRARAAKSPSGVRGRGWTRVGRCAWTGAFEDVLLPRFSRGASGVTDARGSCSRPPSRRPAQTRRAEGKGCESGRALVRGGVAGTAVRARGRRAAGGVSRPVALPAWPAGESGPPWETGARSRGRGPWPARSAGGDPRGGLEAARVRKRRREQVTAQGRAPDARGAPETFARLRFGVS